MAASDNIYFGSFRDPSGFIFFRDGLMLRQINHVYKDNYELLIKSGLYDDLTDNHMLVKHEQTNFEGLLPDTCYKVIQPNKVPFIFYPYEWCFSQLKDAALLTLEIQKKSLDYGMTLKDCSAYNIQFMKGKPVFIDTLSFEIYQEGTPWVAYKQFCQHFLAPLLLMSYRDIRLNQLLKVYIDGIPLDLASILLPSKTRFNFAILTHIHLHAKVQKHYLDINQSKIVNFSQRAFLALIDNLERAIRGLQWNSGKTEWSNYYQETNYSERAFAHKKQIVSKFLAAIKPEIVWDLGANTGFYSMIAADQGATVVAFDYDPAAVDLLYTKTKKEQIDNILPILIDLSNPSPNLGWDNQERMSFQRRGPVDTVLALALIHHLAISNNVPLTSIASFLKKICNALVIEFVPKEDSQVKRLLATREDIFTSYRQDSFENSFRKHFIIREQYNINDSVRTLYLMHRI